MFTFETERFVFKFSSLFYLIKFEEDQHDFRNKLEGKLKTLYLMPVSLGDYSDVILYSKIEKRGFYVLDKLEGTVIQWLGNTILNGQIKTNGNLNAM